MSNTPKLIIEESTNYAFALEQKQSDGHLSFYAIRETSAQLYKMMQLPEVTQKRLYDEIERGVCPLNKEPHLNAYMYYFGKMHNAKLRRAYDNLSTEFRQHETIDIVDYGCGQAMGCICYADFLRENDIRQRVRRVVLIEPSELALARAALHVSLLFPDAEISSICKGFDDLLPEELCSDVDVPTLHILSNVLDLGDKFYGLDKFADLVSGVLKGYNEFVCVGPRYGHQNDLKIAQFMERIGAKTYYATQYRAGELAAGETWTGIICCGNRNEEKYVIDFKSEDGYSLVRKDWKYGLIDMCSRIVIPIIYDRLNWSQDEGIATVKFNGKWQIVDKTGKKLSSIRYDDIANFEEGYARVELDGKYGYINNKGIEIVPVRYDDAGRFYSHGLAKIKLNSKWGYIDIFGNEVVPLKYDDAYHFFDGLGGVKLNGKCGFIDKTGKEIIPIKYDDINSFQEGLAAVKLNNCWGFINKSGQEITPIKYDSVRSFFFGFAEVKLNYKYGIINKQGKEITPIQYDNTGIFFNKGLMKIIINGKHGLIDNIGKEVIPPQYGYTDIEIIDSNLVRVRENGEWKDITIK